MPDQLLGNGTPPIPEILWYACDGMMVIDERRRVLAINPALQQLLGCRTSDAVGKAECGVLLACHNLEGCPLVENPAECPGLKAMHEFKSVRGAEYTLQTPSGKRVMIGASYTPIQLPDRPIWALAILRDITLQKRRELRLIRQAKTDPLTALPNRTAFSEFLQKELTRALRYGRRFTLAIADLDGFKAINDSLGHPAGDELLRAVAGLLRAGRRTPDLVARYGGDEFMVLLPETDAAGAMIVSERLCYTIAHFPFAWKQSLPTVSSRRITLSVGLVLCPEDGTTSQALISKADQRLYEAKRQGGNRVCGPTRDEKLG